MSPTETASAPELDLAPEGGDGASAPLDRAAVNSAAAAVVHLLAERGESLAAVESLTGGLLAAAVVDVAGASRVFRGGLVVYATELKATLAGVPRDLLGERGPVDPDVAVALAEGGRARCGSDWCLATTGVAGPEPQGGKPVGLVFVAAAGPTGTTVRRLELDGNRLSIRTGATLGALRMLARRLHGGPDGSADGDPDGSADGGPDGGPDGGADGGANRDPGGDGRP